MLETVLASCIFLLTAPTPAASSEIAAVSEPPQVQTCSCKAETLVVKGDRTRKGAEIDPLPDPLYPPVIPVPPSGTTPLPDPLNPPLQPVYPPIQPITPPVIPVPPQGASSDWNPMPTPVKPSIPIIDPPLEPVNPTSSNNKPFPGPGPNGEENVGSCSRCGRNHNNH